MEEKSADKTLLDKYIVKEKEIKYCKGVSADCMADGCYRISKCSCDSTCSDSGGC
jgi:hypothetical protein